MERRRLTAIRRSLRFILRWLLLVIMLLGAVWPRPAAAEITDTPVPFVLDAGVEEWAAGAGLVYWGENCFADEQTSHADLNRKPAAGGAVRTLETIDDGNLCNTYLAPLSTGDGFYYYDMSQSRIERMPLGEPYTAQVVKALTADQAPSMRRGLVEAGDYLYWVNFSPGQLLRTRKDGTGEIETVAAGLPFPRDLIVVGSTVFWSDEDGIHSIGISCDELPCTDTITLYHEFGDNVSGYSLLYQFTGGLQGTFRIYWVEHQSGSGGDFTDSIKYRSCSQFVVCYLAPPVGQLPPPAPTFYTATPKWAIGQLLLANGNLFWTEADFNTPNNNNGDVKRRAYDAASGTGAETIATGQADIDDQLYLVNDMLFFARTNNGIYTLPLDAAAITRDFSLDGVEVTQGIQNLANGAPLAAEKTTYVRAYARQLSGPNAPNVEARLVGTRGGAALPGSPLQPVNGVRALITGRGFDRAQLDDGWYFLLPSSWTDAGLVTLEVEVDPRRIHTDPTLDNNKRSVNVTFQDQPPVCVWTVPVRTHTPLPQVGDPNFWQMVSQFNRRWPVPDTWIFRDTEPDEEVEVCWWGPVPYPCFGPYELEDGWGLGGIPDRDKVITSLWTRAQLSFNPDACDDIGAPVHFMGMVHPTANNGGAAGYASTVSKQSWVQLPDHTPNPMPPRWNAMREGSTMAQELAHNYGRKHVNCNNPENIDNNYPYPPCQIAPVGPESYYGFDVATLQPIEPDETADFMSYASRSWVSDYTWRSLINKFAAVAAVSADGPAEAAAGRSVFVTGLVDAENLRGAITSLLLLPAESLPPATRARAMTQVAGQGTTPQHDEPAAAVFKLRLLNAQGDVLVERTLALVELDDHQEDSHAALFTDLFPEPAGTVAKVQLLADGTVIDERAPDLNAPTITIQQPANGTVVGDKLTIAWTADDPDQGDALFFTIQYSHDGGASWHTIALNVPGTLPDTNYLLELDDLGSLHGSAANAGRIRILATDGYNTTIATSQPFTLQNRPPEPAILLPVAGQTYPAGTGVLLQGTATDAEDGGLSGDALVWQVDGADAGTGSGISIAGLNTGEHEATLAATDANNQTAAATVNFEVAPLSIPLGSAPLLDGLCTDEAYADGISVSLQPYDGEAQASVHLLRSDDYLWLCFSGLKPGAENPGSFVGLRADIDNSRPETAQAAEAGFFVGEDGDVFTRQGNGAGDFVTPGPGGLQGQIATGSGMWSAELRIDRAALGGWDHLMNLSVGHHWVTAQNDDYVWPYKAGWAQPRTWAAAALGSQPLITALDPFSATVQGPPFTLTVTGLGFVDGTQVLWNGQALNTTFVDAATLTAQVPAARTETAGVVPITTQSPAPGAFVSNDMPFVVQGLPPLISSLSPASTLAGRPSLTLTINGSNFSPDAQVLWNGMPLSTQFVNSGQLRVQLDAALLADGQSVGVAVANPSAPMRISSAVTFEIESGRIFLPLLATP